MVGRDVDREDVVVLLLVGDERLASGLDEGVVVEHELAPLGTVTRGREAPEGSSLRVDEEDPVVSPVGDQHPARQRAFRRDHAVRILLGLWFRLGLRRLRMVRPAAAGEHGSA